MGDPAAELRGCESPGRAETALLRAVLHILFGVWGLSAREVAPILGDVPLRTLFYWRERPETAHVDTVLRYRLSALLALHRVLRQTHPAGAAQRGWLRAPDADGRSPVTLLMEDRIGAIHDLRDWLQVGTGGVPDGR